MGDMGWDILQTGLTKTSCRDEDKETRLVNSICISIIIMIQILLCHGISQSLLSELNLFGWAGEEGAPYSERVKVKMRDMQVLNKSVWYNIK
jgi:hypothetical protein